MALTPVLTDDFNRADESLSASSDWDRINFYFGEPSVTSNVVDGPATGGVTNATAASHTADQYAQADVTPPSGYGGRLIIVGVRFTGTISGGGVDTLQGYEARIVGSGACTLEKYDEGTLTQLYTGATVSSSDTVRLEVDGTTTTELRLYINDVLEDSGSGFTAQDTTSPFTSGSPALAAESPGSIDNWESGDITAGATGSGLRSRVALNGPFSGPIG